VPRGPDPPDLRIGHRGARHHPLLQLGLDLQRRVVFGLDKAGIQKIATDAAAFCRTLESMSPSTEFFYEYSPESFTGTELDYALEVCNAVIAVIDPTPDRPLILNLPATVEMYTPNLYADAIEWFLRHVDRRDSVVLSLHPHNDRGTGVAAAELGVLAAPTESRHALWQRRAHRQRGRREPGAQSLLQGVDPELDIRDIDKARHVAEYANRLPVHMRHPYVGELVYTAFSGSTRTPSRRNAGDRGFLRRLGGSVPAIDPKHTGRTYEAIIRVNSSPVRARRLPTERRARIGPARAMQVEFSKQVQELTEATGTEISPPRFGTSSRRRTNREPTIQLLSSEVSADQASTRIFAQLVVNGHHVTVKGEGNGPIDALMDDFAPRWT